MHPAFESLKSYAEIYGCKILADNLGCTMGRGECRYFEPEYIHSAPDGGVGQDEIHCSVEDWKRWEDYNNNYWCMMGCVATVYRDGVEIAESSVWGVESDGGKEYLAEIEEEELAQALHQAELSLPVKELLSEAEEEWS